MPVSIADLGGTEIDLRFSSPMEGNISVVVAPVLRFSSSKLHSSPHVNRVTGGSSHFIPLYVHILPENID